MKLIKLFKVMIVLTILSLIYINLQMQIFDLAYKAKKKEKEIRKLLDDNGGLTYAILTLKSANNLGDKLLSENSDLKFHDPKNVVNLETSRPVKTKVAEPKNIEKKQNLLLTLFSLKSQAEASLLNRKRD